MARILIRNDTREILFFTHDSLFSDINDFVNAIEAKYPGNTSFLTISNAANVPANLRIGAYIDSTNRMVSLEPFGDVLVAFQRKRRFLARLDEHQEVTGQGGLQSVPPHLAPLWYRYLRMMTQVSLNDSVYSDAVQWPYLSDALAHNPYDLDGMTTAQVNLFNNVFGDDGEFALGWWNVDRKERVLRTHVVGDGRTDPSSTDYDYRYGSLVAVIPAADIDRSDAALLPAAQPWTRKEEVVAAINERFPWYISNHDASLSDVRFTPNYLLAFYSATTAYSFTVPNSVSSITLAVHTASHTSTVLMTGAARSSSTGSITILLTVGVTNLQVVVTSGSGATKTYTFAITRETA